MSFTLPPVDPELIKKLEAGRPYKHNQIKRIEITLPDSKTFYIKFIYDITTDEWISTASSEALEDLGYFYGMVRDGEPQ